MSKEREFHFEALTPEQQKLWPDLKGAADLNYTLYGGAAIALRLGHRQSLDLDFFSSDSHDSKKMIDAMPFLKTATQIQNAPDTKSYLVPMDGKNVKLSFFNDLTMGRVGNPEFTPDGVVRLASPEDLMASKVKVILQRVEIKDYQDLAAMCRAGYNIKTGLGAAETIYAPDFSPIIGAKAMSFFQDGDLHKLSEQDKNVLVKTVNALDLRNTPKIPLLSKDLAGDGGRDIADSQHRGKGALNETTQITGHLQGIPDRGTTRAEFGGGVSVDGSSRIAGGAEGQERQQGKGRTVMNRARKIDPDATREYTASRTPPKKEKTQDRPRTKENKRSGPDITR